MNINKIKETLVCIVVFPIVIIYVLYLFLITPIDYFRYKRSMYYKDTKEKYSWLCTLSHCIKLYDLIKKHNLPIDYYRDYDAPLAGDGYFIYKDILILSVYETELCFDETKNIWTIEIEDEYVDIKEEVEADIKRCNDFLKDNICTRALVFIYDEVYKEHPDVKYEKIDFLPVKNNSYIDALKTIIE